MTEYLKYFEYIRLDWTMLEHVTFTSESDVGPCPHPQGLRSILFEGPWFLRKCTDKLLTETLPDLATDLSQMLHRNNRYFANPENWTRFKREAAELCSDARGSDLASIQEAGTYVDNLSTNTSNIAIVSSVQNGTLAASPLLNTVVKACVGKARRSIAHEKDTPTMRGFLISLKVMLWCVGVACPPIPR